MAIAHLDRAHINNPKKIIPIPITNDEIENCIHDFTAQINEFKAAYDGSAIPGVDPEMIIQIQLEDLQS